MNNQRMTNSIVLLDIERIARSIEMSRLKFLRQGIFCCVAGSFLVLSPLWSKSFNPFNAGIGIIGLGSGVFYLSSSWKEKKKIQEYAEKKDYCIKLIVAKIIEHEQTK